MAEIVPVCAVLNSKGRSGQSSRQCQLYEPDQRLPTHLEEVYKQSTKGLDPEECDAVLQLLCD